MGYGFPLNDRFVRFDGIAAYAAIPESISLGGGNRIHVTLDCFLDALPGSELILAGKPATSDWALAVDDLGAALFVVRRSGGDAFASTAAGTIEPGKRYILEGVDDGETVTIYVNGVAGEIVGTPAAGSIATDAQPYIIAGNEYILGVYAFQYIRDEFCVCRLYPRFIHGDTPTEILDTSSWNNNAALNGTIDTDLLVGTSTQYEPIYAGSMTL